MADNVTLNAMSGGTTVAADDIGSVLHQRVKVQYGPDGSATDVSLGTPIPVTIAELQAAMGSVTGLATQSKFGSFGAVSVGGDDIWDVGGAYPWPTTAESLRIKAGGNVNDDAAGTGARSVVVTGLNDSWNEVTETLVTAGAGASANTTALFTRVYRVYVESAGTYTSANTGNIVIENVSSLQVLATIQAGMGQTQMTQYTVPLGKTAYLSRVNITVDSTKSIDLTMWQRRDADDVTTPFTGKRLVMKITGATGAHSRQFFSMPSFPAKTDLWWSGIITAATGAVEVTYDLFLVG